MAFCCILFSGCKKDPVDFRTKFLGDYNFNISEHWYSGIPPHFSEGDTSYSYPGKVERGSVANTVFISSSINANREFTIDEAGILNYGNGSGSLSGCSGKFETANKVSYSFSFRNPGSGNTGEATGVRK